MKSKVGETITWLWWRRIGLLNNIKRKNPFADLLRVMAVKMRWKVLRNRRQDSELGEAEMNCASPWAIPRWRVGGNFTTDSEQNKWENDVQPTMWFTFPASLTPKIFLSNDGKFVKRKFLWRNFVWCFVAFSVTFCVFFYFCHPQSRWKAKILIVILHWTARVCLSVNLSAPSTHCPLTLLTINIFFIFR